MLIIAIGLFVWMFRSWSRRRSRPVNSEVVQSVTQLHRTTTATGASILTTWTVVSWLLLLLEVYRDNLGVLPIPAAPSYHYLLSLSAALCIWFVTTFVPLDPGPRPGADLIRETTKLRTNRPGASQID
jgi:hypothetical protein